GSGNADPNLITGNGGNNVLAGLGGADTLDGGAGLDTASYAASAGNVYVSLAAGAAIGGDAAGDLLIGIENLTGSNLNDTLEGDSGNNVLIGGSGVDLLTYEHATAGVAVSLAAATAQATGGAGTDTVSLFENLTGSAYGDTLTGGTAGNLLSGLAGDDSLTGGAGADTMVGGTGNDTYAVDKSSDVVTENPGEGFDVIVASVTYTLPVNVERLTLTGTAINGAGNGDANLITGNSGNNLLSGLGGADTLDGGAGADSLAGGLGADRFVFGDVAAPDTITDFSHAQGDLIDLSAIDANSGLVGDQGFVFIGTAAFHGVAGELRYAQAGSGVVVTGDLNGDGFADFTLNLSGVSSLVNSDFVL
ncbi:MAG TPA: calcium-binding protein, partial [Phenylobacterium sp.]